MSSFGETLKNAREAKGLTCSQVAKQTHMLVQTVEEMEKEDFHRIPAPIYGRGFVRLFAECVGLDPLPLVREFMDIYEGRRAPTVRTREVPVAEPPPPAIPVAQPVPEPISVPEPLVEPEPIPEPEPEPIQEPVAEPIPEPVSDSVPEPAPTITPAPVPQDLEPEPTFVPPPPAEPVREPVSSEPPPILKGLDLFEQAAPAPAQHEDEPLFKSPVHETTPVRTEEGARDAVPTGFDSPFLSSSAYDEGVPSAADRFRDGLSSVSHGVLSTVGSIPRSTWRIALLALGSLIVLAFLVWGVMALYKATSTTTPPPAPQGEGCTNGACEFQPPAKKTQPEAKAPSKPSLPEANSAASKSVPTGRAAPAKAAKPSEPVTLQSTGQKIPPLYAD